MGCEIYTVDAFANRPFTGNPAAVCLLDAAADKAWMQAVANEINLSETAFLLRKADEEWELRWFTPKVEVNLCGHATLASAHVLWREAGIQTQLLRFHTRSGVLIATRDANEICLDFPADPVALAASPAGLESGLGVEVQSVYRGREKFLVVLPDANAVRDLTPDLPFLMSLDAQGVIVTAQSDRPSYDFISRFFAPKAGVPEDPVTGSAHCALGPFWGGRLGKSMLRGFQASARGGAVGVRLHGERVELRGEALTVQKGILNA